MGNDRAEQLNRADKLQDSRAALGRASGAHYLPPRLRLEHAARLHPGLQQRPDADVYRGPCPVCRRAKVFVLRLDENGDIQRKCHRQPSETDPRPACTTADIQNAAPVALDILKAHPLPAEWPDDDGSEHAAAMLLWWQFHGDADDAPPRRRASVKRGLYAHGAAARRAGSAEYNAAASSLALDAGRDPRRFRGRDSITAWILALPSRPIERLSAGRVTRRAGRLVQETSRYRINFVPADARPGSTSAPPNVAPGGNLARGAGGERWRTLDAWPDFGRAAMTHAGLVDASGLSLVTVKRHVRALLDLGLAVEVDAPPTEAGRTGRPRKWYALTAEAAAAIELRDDAALCALARLAPERQHLRGKAARKISRAAETFARAIQAPGWGMRDRAAAAAADAAPGKGADLAAWRTRRPIAAALDAATVSAASAQPGGPAAADAAADVAAAAGIAADDADDVAAVGER